jgi:hypothetical protein
MEEVGAKGRGCKNGEPPAVAVLFGVRAVILFRDDSIVEALSDARGKMSVEFVIDMGSKSGVARPAAGSWIGEAPPLAAGDGNENEPATALTCPSVSFQSGLSEDFPASPHLTGANSSFICSGVMATSSAGSLVFLALSSASNLAIRSLNSRIRASRAVRRAFARCLALWMARTQQPVPSSSETQRRVK